MFREVLEKIGEELKRVSSLSEDASLRVRRAGRKAKRAILLIHAGRLEEARGLIEEALGELREVERMVEAERYLRGLPLGEAYEELSEAVILLSLVSGLEPPTPEELSLPPRSYVLGLADVIGELRRNALDLIRAGRLEEAEKRLELMEEIYLDLASVDELFIHIPGLRRKCDVARRVIEATRGDLTIELRRNALERLIRRLEEVMGGEDRRG